MVFILVLTFSGHLVAYQTGQPLASGPVREYETCIRISDRRAITVHLTGNEICVS